MPVGEIVSGGPRRSLATSQAFALTLLFASLGNNQLIYLFQSCPQHAKERINVVMCEMSSTHRKAMHFDCIVDMILHTRLTVQWVSQFQFELE